MPFRFRPQSRTTTSIPPTSCSDRTEWSCRENTERAFLQQDLQSHPKSQDTLQPQRLVLPPFPKSFRPKFAHMRPCHIVESSRQTGARELRVRMDECPDRERTATLAVAC